MNTIDCDRTARAIVAAVGRVPDAGRQFEAALTNRPVDHDWTTKLKRPAGLTMCYGDPEGIAAIARSFNQLQQPTSLERFAALVTESLQRFAQNYSEDTHNLCYAHFLLHGLALPSAREVAAKIDDNARIISETSKVQDSFLQQMLPKIPVDGYVFKLERGDTDDFNGISLQLQSTARSFSNVFAKVGFFIDTSSSSAIVINVQGRRILNTSDEQFKRQQKEEGRQFARLAARLGMDPRAYVLTKAFTLLEAFGVKEIRAIRPEEHVMAIGNHRGFRANYRHVLESVGMQPIDDTYYSITRLPTPQVA